MNYFAPRFAKWQQAFVCLVFGIFFIAILILDGPENVLFFTVILLILGASIIGIECNSCQDCGTSIFDTAGGGLFLRPTFWMDPQSTCSKCGRDLWPGS